MGLIQGLAWTVRGTTAGSNLWIGGVATLLIGMWFVVASFQLRRD